MNVQLLAGFFCLSLRKEIRQSDKAMHVKCKTDGEG